jgi:hypothetical protein
VSSFGGRGKVAPVSMMKTPRNVLEACRRLLLVRPACPTRVPSTARRTPGVPGPALTATWTVDASHIDDVDSVSAGVGTPTDPSEDRPPSFVHLVIAGGNLKSELASIGEQQPTEVTDGLMTSSRRTNNVGASGRARALLLGRRMWGDHAGTLTLEPSFGASGSLNADHIVFRWSSDGRPYAISLHGWEPFRQAVATLRRVVEST